MKNSVWVGKEKNAQEAGGLGDGVNIDGTVARIQKLFARVICGKAELCEKTKKNSSRPVVRGPQSLSPKGM